MPLPYSALIRRLAVVFCLVVVVLFSQAAPSFAQELVLENLVVDNQDGRITVRFGLEIDRDPPIKKILRNGEELGLFCTAVLQRKRSVWFNEEVGRASLTAVLRHDALAREFEADLPGQPRIRDRQFEVLVDKALGSIQLDLGPWTNLTRGDEYVLTLDIGVRRVEVPNWLKTALFFWSWDVAPPLRYQLTFAY